MVGRVERRGLHPSNPPRGYRRRREDDREWVEPDPETARDVVRMFRRYAEGATLRGLARRHGMTPKEVKTVLTNTFYTGTVRLRLRANAAGPAEVIEAKGGHEAIFPKGLFRRVQERVGSRGVAGRALSRGGATRSPASSGAASGAGR